MRTKAFAILTTTDLRRTRRFYRELLGWTQHQQYPSTGDPVYVTLVKGDSWLGIGEDPVSAGKPRDTGVFSLCVYVDDCDATVARLLDSGVTVLSSPRDQPWGERMAEVADPDGVRVTLLSPLSG